MKYAGPTSILISGVLLALTPARGAELNHFIGQLDLSAVYAQRLGLDGASRVSPDSRGGSESVVLALADIPTVPASQLEDVRGGFALPGGITVNFGFESSTFVQNQGGPSLVQWFNVQAQAAGSTVGGLITTVSNGNVSTAPITPDTGSITLPTIVNNGATAVVTTLSSSGISTLINNSAANQLIQHTQVANIDIAGLKQQLVSQAAYGLVTSALQRANMYNRH